MATVLNDDYYRSSVPDVHPNAPLIAGLAFVSMCCLLTSIELAQTVGRLRAEAESPVATERDHMPPLPRVETLVVDSSK